MSFKNIDTHKHVPKDNFELNGVKSMDYRALYAKRKTQTPQNEPIDGTVENSAGGYVFAVDNWTRLSRFLVLGSEGGTYYIAQKPLTRENAKAIEACIAEDGLRVVKEIVAISDQGRAPKNDPALFALAMCASLGNEETRKTALSVLPKVARTGTHLFHFVHFVDGFRGWGRSLRRAIANWYLEMDTERLSLQLVKYKQRDGWSHRDLLRLSHPKTKDSEKTALLGWTVQPDNTDRIERAAKSFRLIDGISQLKDKSAAQSADIIHRYSLPREVVPTEFLNEAAIWNALLVDMPITAIIRNLGKMSSIGFLGIGSDVAKHITKTLRNADVLKKARIHPLSILMAQKTYASGKGIKGSLSWTAVPSVIDALDDAFYAAFKNVKPTGKRIMLALDVSGSMALNPISGTAINAREGSASMALITAATEENVHIIGFTAGGNGITKLPISARQRLDDVIKSITNLQFGATDCALPILYALENKLKIDAFIIYTDNETWAGTMHPVEALRQYREQMGIPAKLIVVGMASNGFSIADPNDTGMMDIVGFDSATPSVIADFIRSDSGALQRETEED